MLRNILTCCGRFSKFAVLVPVLLFAFAAPAFADQCDLLINWNVTGAYYLDNVYQTTPSGNQTPSIALENGQIYTWNVRVQNDGASSRAFFLKATGTGGNGWTVNYKHDAANITNDILGNGWTTPVINTGAYIVVSIEVTPDGTVSLNSTKVTRIDAYLDESDETIDDAVQGTYRVADLAPDLMIRTNHESTDAYDSNDVYQSTPSGDQVETQSVDGTVGAWYRIKLQNDGTVSRYFRVKATGGSGNGWTVVIKSGYYDNTATFLSAEGLYTLPRIISVKITPDNTVAADATKEVLLEVFGGADDTTVRDSVKCVAVATGGHGHYVATNGLSTNDGTINSPWDLQTALNDPAAVVAGDTIWLRGGTYGAGGNTIFESRLRGTSSARITVRQYPGERATIDGGINEINSASGAQYVTYRDFEITNSSTNRVCLNLDRSNGLKMYTPQAKAVNLIVHDTGHPAIGYWMPVGDGGEVDGCIIWGTGVYAQDASYKCPAGNGIYSQNQNGTRYIRGVIAFRNFTNGFKCYSEGGYANGFWLEGNTCFDTGHYSSDASILLSTFINPITGLKFLSNNTYKREGDYGYGVLLSHYDVEMGDAEVRDNYIVNNDATGGLDNAIRMIRWPTFTFTGNTIVIKGSADRFVDFKRPQSAMNYTWDNNTYHNVGNSPYPFVDNGYAFRSYASWQSTFGFDANSTHTTSAPSTNRITYRQSPHEPGRTYVTIYNWENSANITIDLAQCGVEYWDRYDIRDAQNYFGTKIISNGLSGSTSPVIPMSSISTVAQPVGSVTEDNPNTGINELALWQAWSSRFTHTAPFFGVFVVERTNTQGGK